MKKFSILLLCLLLGYCYVPLKTVSSIIITVEDQDGGKISQNAHVSFLDSDDEEIVSIESGQFSSWENNLHWWAHSYHKDSLLRPADARRAKAALISAQNCSPLRIPVAVAVRYSAPSFSPHGGGPAYMFYDFKKTVKMDCSVDQGKRENP